MGSGRDKRKKKNPPPPGRGAEKTERKTEKAQEKRQRRLDREGEDIDAILEKIRLEEEAAVSVQIEDDVPPPTPRCNCTLTVNPLPKTNELIIFGGEAVVKDKTMVYSDLYVFHVDKQQWRRVRSPNSPLPRCAHQAVSYKNFIFVFGGEFTSPKQEKFHHYKELWRLDVSTWAWELLPLRGGPSARSGHRMVLFKNKLLVFGGFYDVGRETKYYNDLYELDLDSLKWQPIGKPGDLTPPTRSGCQMVLHAEAGVCYMFGGYRKEADDDGNEKGVVLSDCWQLNLKNYAWSKVKRQGIAPGPRSGFCMAPHKARAVLFGGCVDHEAKGGEVIISEFYNEMYTFQFDSQRWYPLGLRGAPQAKGQGQGPGGGGGGAAGGDAGAAAAAAEQGQGEAGAGAGAGAGKKAPREPRAALQQQPQQQTPLERAATRIQAAFRGYAVRKVIKIYKIGGVVNEMLYAPALGFPPPKSGPAPFGRINTSMAVAGNTLWLFGGLVEVGDREIAFDDLWSLDLVKLQQWNCVVKGTVKKEDLMDDQAQSSSSEEDDDEEGGQGSSSSSDDDGDGGGDQKMKDTR